ncbi:MAG: hypothetical protein J7527_20040, partial [Chitinophagaceae bacterium]|nr:hypothetical protein [Chitinophagaceae bacterium]
QECGCCRMPACELKRLRTIASQAEALAQDHFISLFSAQDYSLSWSFSAALSRCHISPHYRTIKLACV